METANNQYLEGLIELAEEKTPVQRRALLEEISDLFVSTHEDVGDHESELMGEILNRLLHEVEMSVRRTLAVRLADIDDAPRDLITTLANDDIEVATPILQRSGVLNDSDLIEIVRHRTQEHMLAVARRDAVSEEVSDALVDEGDEDVIETLLDNHSALVSRRAISYLASESKRVDRFQQPLLSRPDIPGEVAFEMFEWVSGALRQHILTSYDLDESVVDDAIEETKQDVLADGDEDGQVRSEAEKLVRRLEQARLLTENFVVQALRDGRVDVFVTALAVKTNIELKMVRRIFFDHGDEGLAVACKASGFDRSTFASLVLLKRKGEVESAVMEPTELEKLMSLYDTTTQRSAKRVLHFWSIRERETPSEEEDAAEGPVLSGTA